MSLFLPFLPNSILLSWLEQAATLYNSRCAIFSGFFGALRFFGSLGVIGVFREAFGPLRVFGFRVFLGFRAFRVQGF